MCYWLSVGEIGYLSSIMVLTIWSWRTRGKRPEKQDQCASRSWHRKGVKVQMLCVSDIDCFELLMWLLICWWVHMCVGPLYACCHGFQMAQYWLGCCQMQTLVVCTQSMYGKIHHWLQLEPKKHWIFSKVANVAYAHCRPEWENGIVIFFEIWKP